MSSNSLRLIRRKINADGCGDLRIIENLTINKLRVLNLNDG